MFKRLILLSLVALGMHSVGCKPTKKPAAAPPPPAVTASSGTDSSSTGAASASATNDDLAVKADDSRNPDSSSATEPIGRPNTSDGTASSDPSTEDTSATKFDFGGNWTTRRMVALAPAGPLVIDLSVSIGKKSLEEAFGQIASQIKMELFDDEKSEITWQSLLEHPTVQSGWLGNLIPDEEQTDQLISMYDTERDDIVDTDTEFLPFLSRGLSRNSPLQVSDVGLEGGSSAANSSPWGRGDQNEDYSLDQQELDQFATNIAAYDYDGDAVITVAELQTADSSDAAAGMAGSMNMLQTATLLVAQQAEGDADSKQYTAARRQLARSIMRHYTFLAEMSRDLWSRWDDQNWQALDSDGDASLDIYELEKIIDLEPHIEIWVRFDGQADAADADMLAGVHSSSNMSENAAAREAGRKQSSAMQVEPAGRATQMQVYVQSVQWPAADYQWMQNGRGGRLSAGGVQATLSVTDAFSAAGQQRFRQQLTLAISNAQLRTALSSQLGLQEGGFDLVDANEDGELSDGEFAKVWNWLRVRQSTRLVARWSKTAQPWFLMLDRNGDNQLTEQEIAQLPEIWRELDQNDDRLVTPNELPLLARLEIERADTRLSGGPLNAPQGPAESGPAEDWFAAMDENADGILTIGEFLGSRADFDTLDLDKDGFVGRSEVYSAETNY